jgi:hypothetical protein
LQRKVGKEAGSESWKIPTNHSKCLPKLWKILLLTCTFLKFPFIYFLFSGSTKEGSLASGRTKSKEKKLYGRFLYEWAVLLYEKAT